jgi:hypothetical protein
MRSQKFWNQPSFSLTEILYMTQLFLKLCVHPTELHELRTAVEAMRNYLLLAISTNSYFCL